MTREQTNKLYKVQELLNQCREILDNVMYYSEPITARDHEKVRACYDTICEAMDKL